MSNKTGTMSIFSATGTLLALACCLGFGPLLAILSAIGLGFLINDLILLPILLVFLATGAVGLHLSSRKSHGRKLPFYLHLGSAVVLVTFMFAYFQPAIWLGIAGIFTASILDLRLRLKTGACSTGDACHTAPPSTEGKQS